MKLLSGECQRILLMMSTLVEGNGLVPSANKLLPEPMLTQFYVIISSNQATMG